MQITASAELLSSASKEFVDRAATTELPVFLMGETGTGKSLLARLIHERHARRSGPFVSVPCGALPSGLMERELFGHRKGAFTGADGSRQGLVATADLGTLLLDDIDGVPFDLQSKILDLAENRRIRPVGATSFAAVDVRLIATTNQDVALAVASGVLRGDLCHRLGGWVHTLRPLRERTGEFPTLTKKVWESVWREQHRGTPDRRPAFSDEALERLRAHPWLGNLRELVAVAARLAASARTNAIGPKAIEWALSAGLDLWVPENGRRRDDRVPSNSRYRAPSDPAEERRKIVAALCETEGVKTRAAELLGMSRQTLWARLREYRIWEEEWTASDAFADGER